MSTRVMKSSGVVMLVCVLVLLTAEGAARVLEPQLDEPVLWGDLETQLKVEQMDALAESGGADVVFLGSSIVNAGIDPELYEELSNPGTVVYNAALNATSPRLLELWSREIVLPRLQPELVVIGLSSRELNDNGVNQAEQYDRYTGSIGRAFEIGQPTVPQRIDNLFSDFSALVRLRAQLRRPFAVFNQLRGTAVQNLRLTDLGAVTRLRAIEYHVTQVFRERTVGGDLVGYEIGGGEYEALGRLVETIRSTGAEVLLVDMPVMEPDYVPMHPDGRADFNRYQSALKSFSVEHDVRLLVPAVTPWPPSDFADPLHLNESGVERLTASVWEFAANR